MLKFQKDLTSSYWVFAPTRKCDTGQNPGATKIGYKKLASINRANLKLKKKLNYSLRTRKLGSKLAGAISYSNACGQSISKIRFLTLTGTVLGLIFHGPTCLWSCSWALTSCLFIFCSDVKVQPHWPHTETDISIVLVPFYRSVWLWYHLASG